MLKRKIAASFERANNNIEHPSRHLRSRTQTNKFTACVMRKKTVSKKMVVPVMEIRSIQPVSEVLRMPVREHVRRQDTVKDDLDYDEALVAALKKNAAMNVSKIM